MTSNPIDGIGRTIESNLKQAKTTALSLFREVDATLAQSCQPFVAWRLEWVSGTDDRLWPDGVPQIRNEQGRKRFNSSKALWIPIT